MVVPRDGTAELSIDPVMCGGVVQIRTPPSWLPVANMKVSQAWFQAMQVRSPPTVCARMCCSNVPDSLSQMWMSPAREVSVDRP